MIDASHDYRLLVTGDTVNWVFNNILLVDSTTNETKSHGFIRFSIDQLEGNEIGTVIRNKAFIYFDFNDPIITNETENEIKPEDIVGDVDRLEGLGNVYPNPTTGVVNLLEDTDYEVYDLLGVQLLSGTSNTVDISGLSTGIYLINYGGNIERVVKQ